MSFDYNSKTSGELTQRDGSRTQLFGGGDFGNYQQPKPSSLSDRLPSNFDYSQASLSQLESQSEMQMGLMSEKINALKSLSIRMGDEIRGSNNTLDQLGNTFEQTGTKLKKNFKKMMIMAKNSRIPLKTWLIIFGILVLLFFYVWIR